MATYPMYGQFIRRETILCIELLQPGFAVTLVYENFHVKHHSRKKVRRLIRTAYSQSIKFRSQ